MNLSGEIRHVGCHENAVRILLACSHLLMFPTQSPRMSAACYLAIMNAAEKIIFPGHMISCSGHSEVASGRSSPSHGKSSQMIDPPAVEDRFGRHGCVMGGSKQSSHGGAAKEPGLWNCLKAIGPQSTR